MICWGDPHFPSPTHYGSRNLGTTLSSTSSSSGTRGDDRDNSGQDSNHPCSFPNGLISAEDQNLRNFTLTELEAATQNFHSELLLEEVSDRKIYKASFVDQKTPSLGIRKAIVFLPKKKRRKAIVFISSQYHPYHESEIGWQTMVGILGRLYHPNIVPLLGFCYDEGHDQVLHVYDFAAKSSLSNRLFGGSSVSNDDDPLPWETRLRIAIGAARGLAFLHARNIIYRDVMSSSFLLDEFYAVKLSNFRLAMLGPPDGESHLSVPVMGTYGYADPEYVATGNIYMKSDVYSFGIVLLEILTGSRAIDRNNPNGKHLLVEWAGPCLSSKPELMKIVDTKANYPLNVSMPIAQLISNCILPHPHNRPSMPQVVEALEAIQVSTIMTSTAR